MEMMRPPCVQQQRVSPAHEMRPRAPHIRLIRVLGYTRVADVDVNEGVAHADEVEVGRDEEESTWPALGRPRCAEDLGEEGGGEVFEAGVWVGDVGGGVEAGERLLDAVVEGVDYARGVGRCVFEAAGGIAHVVVIEGVYGGSEKSGEDDCLAESGRVSVEVPGADAGEVAAVGVLGLEIEVLEDEVGVFPILHEGRVGLFHDDHFDGGEEVVVFFLLLVGFDGAAEAEGGGEDDV